MPFFNRELNELMDRAGRSDLTIYLHTAAPSDADTDNGRINAGGGLYEIGRDAGGCGHFERFERRHREHGRDSVRDGGRGRRGPEPLVGVPW